jgi:hypothetical protein
MCAPVRCVLCSPATYLLLLECVNLLLVMFATQLHTANLAALHLFLDCAMKQVREDRSVAALSLPLAHPVSMPRLFLWKCSERVRVNMYFGQPESSWISSIEPFVSV